MNALQKIRTPTGVMHVVQAIAQKLLKEGVISGELDGDLHAADAATVKAAIMASSVCDFCSTPGASHYYDVPDFGITTNSRGGTNYSPMVGSSEGGWMACDTCHDLIQRDRRKDLIERAVSIHAFPKFSRRAVEELYAKFWQGMDERAEAAGGLAAILDYIEDKIPQAPAKITDRDRRIQAVERETGLTPAELAQVVEGHVPRHVVAKVVAFNKRYDITQKARDASRARAILEGQVAPPLPTHVPHWQTALDMKLKAYQFLSTAVATKGMVRDISFAVDVKLLHRAQAYSFNGETIAAIRQAAESIPEDSPLSSIEVPAGGAGWFWFGEPMKLPASPSSDYTAALLWGWQPGEPMYRLQIPVEYLQDLEEFDTVIEETLGPNPPVMNKEQTEALSRIMRKRGVTEEQLDEWMTEIEGPPSMAFTAYVFDDKGLQKGWSSLTKAPIPSTRWVWQLDETLHEMIVRNERSWDERYGPGGQFEHLAPKLDKQLTAKVVVELSLFFVMSCLWFKQTVDRPPVLEREQGPMERQERKRMQKEHKLDTIPSVQVVALRKTARSLEPSEPRPEGAPKREYHYRWIVQGHARLQACGPGRKDRKLIWIDAYPKGPEDKPLKTREKVYAVVR